MAGQSGKSKSSHKRAPEETRGLQKSKAERGKLRRQQQEHCWQVNLLASKLRDSEVRDIQDRAERGEFPKTIAKSYPGLDEFTIARVIRHGKLTPWQDAEMKRDKARGPLQEAYAKRHKENQLSAS